MARAPLTVTIITLNEAKNLPRALESIRFADEVIVVDSGSTDGTCEIAQNWGARVFENTWPGYGAQKNFAQAQAKYDWVLNLDADEAVSPELRAAIERILNAPSSGVLGYRLSRRTWHLGRWILHGGWYPNRLVRLAHRRHSRWSEPAVHEALLVDGGIATLKGDLLHYPFSGIADQIRANLRYAEEGSKELERRNRGQSLVHLLAKPLAKFLETYLWKRGFLDGLPGFLISVNAAHSVFLKHSFLHEKRLLAGGSHANSHS